MSVRKIGVQEMIDAGVHFGHKVRYGNPEMRPYVWGVWGTKDRIQIIDLEKTFINMNIALKFVRHVIASRGNILFVGTKSSATKRIREYASSVNMPYVDKKWLGGTLTNYGVIRKTVSLLVELEQRIEANDFSDITKKEKMSLFRRAEKLRAKLGGIKDMSGLPEALFVVDASNESTAIKEANCLSIPVIAIVDTNSSPSGIDYVIPGNDDSRRAIDLYLSAAVDVIKKEQEIIEQQDKDAVIKAGGAKIVRKSSSGKSEAAVRPAAKVAGMAQKSAAKKVEVKVGEGAVAKRPAAKQDEVKKPAAKQDEVKKVSLKESDAKKDVKDDKKPAAKKPAAKKPAAKKPTVKKTEGKAKEGEEKPAVKPPLAKEKKSDKASDDS